MALERCNAMTPEEIIDWVILGELGPETVYINGYDPKEVFREAACWGNKELCEWLVGQGVSGSEALTGVSISQIDPVILQWVFGPKAAINSEE